VQLPSTTFPISIYEGISLNKENSLPEGNSVTSYRENKISTPLHKEAEQDLLYDSVQLENHGVQDVRKPLKL
jgi:hypothetical protein